MKRDYSYIDDIVAGTLAALDKPAATAGHRLYNLAATKSEDIVAVIALFEKALGKEAKVELKPGDPFDMQETAADISDTTRDLGWMPKVRWKRASRCLSSGSRATIGCELFTATVMTDSDGDVPP